MPTTKSVIDVRNPRTGRVDYQIKACSIDEIALTIAQLRDAQYHWKQRAPNERADLLRRFAGSVQRHSKAIGNALAIDTGRSAFSHFEATITVQLLNNWADRCETIFKSMSNHGRSQQVPSVEYNHFLVPYPVVGVISPWNVPLLLALIDAIPALMAGCSVILKPSEVTPRFVAPLTTALADVPELASVLTIVTGGPDTGRAIIDHVDAICFTGSIATGKNVAQHAAQRFIPAFLELGGKDPAIILADANLELASRAVIRSAIGMTGQACQSLERVYVLDSVYDDFVKHLLTEIDTLTLTCDLPQEGDIGPLIFAPQAVTIQNQIDDAVRKGATIIRGGQARFAGGTWYPPTVLTDVTHDMLIMQEETFGPVIPIIKVSSATEAVKLANDSQFGLSGAVFSSDITAAQTLASQLEVGAVSINDASLTGVVNDVEKNSFKLSGLGGSRMGLAGLTRFLRKRAILTQTAEPARVTLYSEHKQ